MHPELSGFTSGTRASGTVLTPPTSATSAQIASVAVYASAQSFATAVAVHSGCTVVFWRLSSLSILRSSRLTNTVGRVTSVALTGSFLFVSMSCGDSSNTIPGCVNSIDEYNVDAGTLTTWLGTMDPQNQVGGWGWRVITPSGGQGGEGRLGRPGGGVKVLVEPLNLLNPQNQVGGWGLRVRAGVEGRGRVKVKVMVTRSWAWIKETFPVARRPERGARIPAGKSERRAGGCRGAPRHHEGVGKV